MTLVLTPSHLSTLRTRLDHHDTHSAQCALPVTVTNATLINGALWAAMRSCVNLTDANELTQYYICSAAKRLPNGPFKVPPIVSV